MKEIKVGEYVRTHKGQIDKFKEYSEEGLFVICENKTYWKSNITKHSSNIIDVIEVGDYVNGWKVRDVYLEGERHYLKLTGLEHARIYDDDIKSIVTHESFNSIKYEVV